MIVPTERNVRGQWETKPFLARDLKGLTQCLYINMECWRVAWINLCAKVADSHGNSPSNTISNIQSPVKRSLLSI